MVNGSQYYRALKSVSIASALSIAVLPFTHARSRVHQRWHSNFLQLGRRSGGRPQRTVYPRRLPVNTVIHTSLASIEPTTFRLLVRRATSSATNSANALTNKKAQAEARVTRDSSACIKTLDNYLSFATHFCVKMKIAISEDIAMRKRPFICSRSSKVIDFGTNRKRVYTFISITILVISCTFRRYEWMNLYLPWTTTQEKNQWVQTVVQAGQ